MVEKNYKFRDVLVAMLNQPRRDHCFRNDRDELVEFFYDQKKAGVSVLKDVRFGEHFGSHVSDEVLGGFRELNSCEVICLTTPRFDLYYINDDKVKGWYSQVSRRFIPEELSCFPKLSSEFFQKF